VTRLFFIMFLLLTSCYKGHLYVQHERIDGSYLASSVVNTPDPRKKDPPMGQKLSVSWNFPLSSFKQNLSLILTVRFWDNKEDVLVRSIDKKRGYTTFFFEDKSLGRMRRILTYRIQVMNERGKIVEEWKHHFWTKLIELNQENPEPLK
jgi:hypothetical protein